MAWASIGGAQEGVPVAKFTDVTTQAGLRFSHINGAYGDKLLPETMGGGVAFFDYDGDATRIALHQFNVLAGHVPEANRFRPWFFITMMAMALCRCDLGLGPGREFLWDGRRRRRLR